MPEPSIFRPLHILFVNRMACLERGGGETFDLEVSRHLAKAGARVSHLCGAPLLRPAPLPVPGARTLRTPWLRRFPWDKVKGGWRVRQLEFEWFEWRAARWVARHATRYDIIQVCELPNFVYWLKKRGAPTPVVMRLTAPNRVNRPSFSRLVCALRISSVDRCRHVRRFDHCLDRAS